MAIHYIDSILQQDEAASAVYNAEPDLVMNINLPNGVCDTINIFQGDDAGVLGAILPRYTI